MEPRVHIQENVFAQDGDLAVYLLGYRLGAAEGLAWGPLRVHDMHQDQGYLRRSFEKVRYQFLIFVHIVSKSIYRSIRQIRVWFDIVR